MIGVSEFKNRLHNFLNVSEINGHKVVEDGSSYYCEECEVSKGIKSLFAEFECGGDPDTTVRRELTVEARRLEDKYYGTYWFEIVEGGRRGFRHAFRTADDITIEVGSYYDIVVESQNERRTIWKVVSAEKRDI